MKLNKIIVNPKKEGKFCTFCGKPLRLYGTRTYSEDTGELIYYWTCRRVLCRSSLSKEEKD